MRTCPITREKFQTEAPEIKVTIAGVEHTLEPKFFGTGSMGWNLNSKALIQVDGTSCECQVGLNITIIGSKRV